MLGSGGDYEKEKVLSELTETGESVKSALWVALIFCKKTEESAAWNSSAQESKR